MSAVNYTTLNPIACVQIKQGLVLHMVPEGEGYVGLGVWEEPYFVTVMATLMGKYDLDISTAPYFMALCESGTNEFTEFGAYTSAGNESFKPRGAILISGAEEYQEFADFLGRPDLLTNQSLVRTELAFDAAYFKWVKHDLGSHCPARTNLRFLPDASTSYELNPPVCNTAALSYMNQATGKNANAEVVEIFCRWADKINEIQSKGANRPTDSLKEMFLRAATLN